MQITDINDFISTAAQLLNAPDLILIAVLLANVWLGARRGLVGALYGVIGRIGMIAASVAAAKYTAPYIARIGWSCRQSVSCLKNRPRSKPPKACWTVCGRA